MTTATLKHHLPRDIHRLLNHSSAVIVIDGKRGDGKTDFSLKLGSDALKDGCITSLASNIISNDPRLKQITNFPDLDYYLKFGKGRKMFILDEAGTALPASRWMSTLSVKFLSTVQLIRHYKARLVFIAPSKKFILRTLQNTEILDAIIEKKKLKIATVKNYLTKRKYNLYDIPPTDITFSQQPSFFTLEKPIKLDRLAEWERDLYEYTVNDKSINQIADETGRYKMQVLRSIKKFGKVYFETKKGNK